jgi:hypothetical protein
LRKERKLRLFEKRVLKGICGPKRDEVTEEWRQLHNAELNDLYSSSNIIWVIKSRRTKWAGHMARIGKGTGVYKVFVGEPEGKRPLGRPRSRWKYNIKMDLQQVGCGGLDWNDLARDKDSSQALLNAVLSIRAL